jgi:hypothetical protein
MDFDPVDADRAVATVSGEGLAPGGRDGIERHLDAPAEADMVAAACWKFVLNGGLAALPTGLADASTIMSDMIGYAHAQEAGGGASSTGRRAERVLVPGPGDCTPSAVTATAVTPRGDALGTQLISAGRQQQLVQAFNAARNDGFNARIIDGPRGGALHVFERTERQQELHYLLVKTVVQLYGFTTISRERAAISHNTLGRKWMTIVVRCSTWWGWDHWAFKGSTVSGVHTVESKYAQTVPDVPACVGCTTFWDEHYPETRVYISHMPRRVYDQLAALHA